jgi:hypothetical protein
MSEWSVLINYGSGLEADIAVARLNAERIPAVARGNDIVAIVGPGFQGTTARGVDVVVPTKMLRRAKIILGLLEGYDG